MPNYPAKRKSRRSSKERARRKLLVRAGIIGGILFVLAGGAGLAIYLKRPPDPMELQRSAKEQLNSGDLSEAGKTPCAERYQGHSHRQLSL